MPTETLCDSHWIADDEAVRRGAFGREPLGIDSAEPGTGGLYCRWMAEPSPENPP